MPAGKNRSEEKDIKKVSITDKVPPECLADPGFVEALATSLVSANSTLRLIVDETDAEIKEIKESVTKGLEKRKVLKELIKELTKKKTVVSAGIESLERESRYRTTEVETVKNRLDDATLRDLADRDQYKKILKDYHETWQKYKDEYEERPKAKERQEACITLKHLRGQLMMAEYKKQNLITMLKQRKQIDSIRVTVSTVEISGMILQRWKDQNHVHDLNKVTAKLQDELKAYTLELSQLEQEDRKKRAEIERSVMPPPRLDFSFMRSYCNEQERLHKRRHPKFTATRDPDSVSINTVILEEMCNAETTEIGGKNNEAVAEGEKESLNIPTSISMISEQVNPISNRTEEMPDSGPSIDLDVQNKLKKLRIEKKTTFVFDKEQEKRQRQVESNANNNYSNIENEGRDYESGTEESHQRTRRWCEESQNEFASFSLSEQRSNSLNEQRKGDFANEAGKSVEQRFAKASSIHGSETRYLRQAEHDKRFKNGASMEVTDETRKTMDFENSMNNKKRVVQKDQTKRRSSDKLGENTAIGVEASPSREKKLQSQIPVEHPQAKTTPTKNQPIYETPQSKTPKLDDIVTSQESKTSDENLELPIDTGCSRPKIRKVEVVNYPLGQRLENTVVMNESQQPDLSYSPKRYVPSCMSSNLSITYETALQETPQISFGGESKVIAGFSSLSNWRNWSPPNSERSLASSISKIGQNTETPRNAHQNLPHEQNQPAQFDLGGFFTIQPTQITKNMF